MLVVIIQAVQGHVGLVRTRAGDGTAAAVLVLLVGGLPAKIQNPGLQAQQIGHVAPFHGQRLDGGVIYRVADRGICCVQCLRFAAHVDCDGCGLDCQFEVDGGRLIDQEIGLLGLRAETGAVGGNDISAWHNLLELIFAASISDLRGLRLVALFTMVTVAPGITAPEGSVIVPRNEGEGCLRPGQAAISDGQKHECQQWREWGACVVPPKEVELSRWPPLCCWRNPLCLLRTEYSSGRTNLRIFFERVVQLDL